MGSPITKITSGKAPAVIWLIPILVWGSCYHVGKDCCVRVGIVSPMTAGPHCRMAAPGGGASCRTAPPGKKYGGERERFPGKDFLFCVASLEDLCLGGLRSLAGPVHLLLLPRTLPFLGASPKGSAMSWLAVSGSRL